MLHTIAFPVQRHVWRPSTLVALGAAAGIVVALIGVAGFLGWVFGIPALKTVAIGFASMKPNTALGFVFGGVAIAAAGFAPERQGLRLALAAVPALLGAASLIEYSFGIDLGIDQFWFADPDSILWPGRMSISTAINMVLLGVGVMVVAAEPRPLRYAAEFIKLAGVLHALLALIGYLYNVSSFYAVHPYSSVALHTAVASFVGFAALYCLRPSVGLAGIVWAENAGGLLARRMLASAVIAPVVIGLVVVRGVQAQSYNVGFALAIFTLASILVLAAVVLHTAYEIGRVDHMRISCLDELRKAHNHTQTTLREKEALLVELTRNEERFRTIADAAPMPLIITRVADGSVTYANAMFAHTFGFSLDQVAAMKAREFYMNPNDRDAVLALLANDGQVNSIELQMRRADGSLLWVVVNAGKTRILGEAVVIASFVDITELKKVQEQLIHAQTRV